jgi:hypothetical protein
MILIYRLIEFSKIKTKAFWTVITNDSRTVDIFNEVEKINQDFYSLLKKQKNSKYFYLTTLCWSD